MPRRYRPRSVRWASLALGLLAASLLANAVPHLLAGLSGRSFMTPFGAESSSAVNLIWGLANVLGGAFVITLPATFRVPVWTSIGAACGVAGTALSLWILIG